MTEPEESAKTHDGISNASGQLVDDEMIDLTDVLATRSVDLRSFGRLRWKCIDGSDEQLRVP